MKLNDIMKTNRFLAVGMALLGCLAVHAEDEVPDPNSFIHKDVKYTIEEQWMNPTALNQLATNHKAGFANEGELFQFFVKDGIIYFCAEYGTGDAEAYNTSLLAVDAEDGSEIGVKEIDWNDLKSANWAAVYCGSDSEHEAFVASYGVNQSANSIYSKFENPFEIYLLNLDGDNPTVVKKYQLPLDIDMWVQRVDVAGSLMSGNFTATATIWESQSIIGGGLNQKKTYIGVWKFVNGEMEDAKGVQEHLTVAKTASIGENLVMVQDGADLKANYDGSENHGTLVRAKHPTIFDVSGATPVIKSTLEKEDDDDDNGNGFAIIDDEGEYFMLYAHKGNPVSIKMIYLPDYPNSFEGAKTVWTYNPGDEFSTAPANNSERRMTTIFVEKPDEDGTNIYLSANGMGMAKLTMTKDEITTGVEKLVASPVDAPAEYFDVMGRRLSGKPATGLYLERRGTDTSKHIAR